MFHGKNYKREKLLESLRRNPKAFDSVKKMVLMQVFTPLAMKAYEWISEKPGRKLVVEHEGGDEPGISIAFTEDGKEVDVLGGE